MGGVLITGGAKRLGAATAKRFHRAGYRIHLHCHTSSKAAQLLIDDLNANRAHSASLYQADLTQPTEIQGLCNAVLVEDPALSVVINNASTFFPTPMGAVTDAQWQQLFDVNTKAPFFIVQALSACLKSQQGCVINFADIHGIRPLAQHAVYSAAKSGVIAMTKALALELAPDIRVNAVAPGAILWPEQATSQDTEKVLNKVPLGRLGTLDDITEAVLFLAQAPYITGQILSVDGGRTLNQ